MGGRGRLTQGVRPHDDGQRVDPQHNAFLSAVLRYLTLKHKRVAAITPEWQSLRTTLADEPIGAMRPAWEQRSYWRMDFSPVPAMIRCGGLDYPCRLLDLSATGARITAQHGESKVGVRAGDQVVLSLRPDRSTLRVELPIEVIHHDIESGTMGVRFRGAPVLTHRRDTVGHLRHRVVERRAQAATQMIVDEGLPPDLIDAPIVCDPREVAANDVGLEDAGAA